MDKKTSSSRSSSSGLKNISSCGIPSCSSSSRSSSSTGVTKLSSLPPIPSNAGVVRSNYNFSNASGPGKKPSTLQNCNFSNTSGSGRKASTLQNCNFSNASESGRKPSHANGSGRKPSQASGFERKPSTFQSKGSKEKKPDKKLKDVHCVLPDTCYFFQDEEGLHRMVRSDLTGKDGNFHVTGMCYADILDLNPLATRLSAVKLKKLNSGNNARDDGVLEGPDTALVVPDESMLRQGANGPVVMGDIGDLKRMRSEGFWSFESELPPVPTCIVPLSKDRQVLLKIGDSFLRVGEANVPLTSKFKPPLYPNVNWDETERLLDPRAAGAKDADIRDRFNFPDFTFYVDETATLMESWYRNTRAFFNVRIAVRRKGEDLKEYLALGCSGANRYYIQYQTSQSGAWWQLLCVGDNKYVCESVTTPGLCLMRSRFGLSISPPLTSRDRAHIRAGKWPENATLTILQLPSFAVWRPGAIIL